MELDARPRMMEKGGFAIVTVCSIFFAHYTAVLPHEYAHFVMAFALGFKIRPLAIHFGTNSLASILLLNGCELSWYWPSEQ
jgi:membrane-associated protease RseP (regulator of RpoE activity)